MKSMKDMAKLFQNFLSDSQVITDESLCSLYGHDWSYIGGTAGLVLFPKSTEEIAMILKVANNHKIPVIPSGGRTGLAAGACATKQELVISLDKMNKIIEIDPVSRTITAEAGVILQTLEEAANQHNLEFPIRLGSSGSCQLGGNISTNAGGGRFLRNGGMRQHVLGLEVVLADGTVLDFNTKLYKNNMGFDLKQLFISSEGTLGIIAKATLGLVSQPGEKSVALIAFDSLKNISTIIQSRNQWGMRILAIELFTRDCILLCLPNGMENFSNHRYFILIEVSESSTGTDSIEKLLENLYTSGEIEDALVAKNSQEQINFWDLRENIPEQISKLGKVFKYDLSVAIVDLPSFFLEIENIAKSVDEHVHTFLFGHVGDGNIHINFVPKLVTSDFTKTDPYIKINEMVYHTIRQYHGSFSAEHGIGLIKKEAFLASLSDSQLTLQRGLKNLLDPNNILNPGKII